MNGILLFFLLFSQQVWAEEKAVATEWEQMEGADQWSSYVGAPNSDNATLVTVSFEDAVAHFKVFEDCRDLKEDTFATIEWVAGDMTGTYVMCDGTATTSDSPPRFEKVLGPLPAEAQRLLHDDTSIVQTR